MSRPSKATVAHCAIAGLVVLFVMSPNIVRSYGYGLDYTTHIWLIWYQGLAIRDTGLPTLFLSATNYAGTGEQFGTIGILEPYYGFYGGTLYSIFGGLSALLGQKPMTAFYVSHVMMLVMAYRGLWLFGRQFGVRPWVAHLPAFLFVTSAYYVTDMYARGSWAELAALSSVPFVLAYGLLLLREPWRTTRVVAFLWGTIILTGSHNISLLWSVVLLAILAIVSYLVAGPARPPVRRIAAVVGVAALAAGVNAWFLLLNVLHSNDTLIAQSEFGYGYTADWNDFGTIMSLIRTTPAISGTFGLTIAAPTVAIVLAAAFAIGRRRSAHPESKIPGRFWWVMAGWTLLVYAIMTMGEEAWLNLGSPFTLIQFPYRLAGYLGIGACLFIALSLRGRLDFGRWSRDALIAGSAALVALTLVQTGVQLYPDTDHGFVVRDRTTAFERGSTSGPDAWYDPGNYFDATLPVVSVDPARRVLLPIPKPGVTTTSGVVTLPPAGTPILTNISGGPWVAKVTGTGFRVVGRAANGQLVIEREPGAPDQARVTVTADVGPEQPIGAVISVVSILGIFGFVGFLVSRTRRGRAPLFSEADGHPEVNGHDPGDPDGQPAEARDAERNAPLDRV